MPIGPAAPFARVESFGEPAVNRSQQFARLLHHALVAPEAGEACGGAVFPGLCLLLATRNGELFSWALQNGLRLVHQMNLMTTGLYNEPAGAFLPSVAC